MNIDWIAVIICLLAVIGLYFLFCKLLGMLVGHRYTVALRAEDYRDEYELLSAWHAAQLSASSLRDTDAFPVVLIEGNVSLKLYNLLREEGVFLYKKMD